MTNDQSTARPWKLILPVIEEEGEETEEGGMIGIIMGDRIDSPGNYTVGNEIKLDENCLPGENEVAEANAKLIVKAVNSYDDSIALAQAVIKADVSESLHLMAYKILHSKG